MSDSIPAITKRMAEVEGLLQSLPRDILALGEESVRLQRVHNRMRAEAAAELGESYTKARTVAEKDRLLFPLTMDSWEALQLNEVSLTYMRDQFKSLDKELMSLASRLKAAMQADRAHAALGAG